jgi:hypothetical protein
MERVMEVAVWIIFPFLVYGIIYLLFLKWKLKTPKLFLYLLAISALASPFYAPSCLCIGLGEILSGAAIHSAIFNVIVAALGFLVLVIIKLFQKSI